MIHPKQTFNIGHMNCSLWVSLTVNGNREYEAMQDECHTGGQEREITPSPRQSLFLSAVPAQPYSLIPRPDHFPIRVFACHIPSCSLSSFSAPHTPFPSLSPSPCPRWSSNPHADLLPQQHLKAGSSGYSLQAPEYRKFCIAWGIKHAQDRQTVGGTLPLWSKKFLIGMCKSPFRGARFGPGSWKYKWCILNSETTQALNFKSYFHSTQDKEHS